MKRPPGVYLGLSWQEYVETEAESRSDLVALMQGVDAYLNPRRTETRATEFGGALHCALLEPERFEAEYLGVTQSRTAALRGAHAGRVLLTAKCMAGVRACRDDARKNPGVRAWLDAHGDTEVSIVWEDEETGIPCKARLDCGWYESERQGLVVPDLKSGNVEPEPFRRGFANFRLHVQAAFYLDGLRKVLGWDGRMTFSYIAYESTEPHRCRLYHATDRAVDIGRNEVRRALRYIKECRDLGRWPDEMSVVTAIDLPGWYSEWKPTVLPSGKTFPQLQAEDPVYAETPF